MSVIKGQFFVVLPDSEEACRVADRVGEGATRVIHHASGRPWLIAHMPDDQVIAGEAGDNRIALVGFCAATGDTLTRAARHSASWDDVAHSTAGSFHLLGSVGGQGRAQGSASGVRRVFHAVIDGVRVVADRADVLAELGDLPFNDTTLAIRLLRALPHPLAEEPLWHGVESVLPGHRVTVDRTGRGYRVVEWWRRPEPVLSRADGATRLCEALAAAVDVRTRDGGVVHSDLSGGMDSTPVTYFAAQGPAHVIASTSYNKDPGGMRDLEWARRALPSMPDVRHHTMSLDAMPQFFEGLTDLHDRLDAPTAGYLAGPRMKVNIATAIGNGARMYLNGLGGDHVLCGLPSWEHTLFRSRPLLAWRRTRANQMLEGKSPFDTARRLLGNEPYRRWFSGLATTARRERMERNEIGLAWDLRFGWPWWLSADALRSIESRIAEIGEYVEPLGPSRAAHSELAVIRDGAHIVRATGQLGAASAMPFEAPFLDDRVVEACLAVRREERVSPKEYKPLIKEAMRGLLPADFLCRTTRASGATQTVNGFRRHADDLFEWCAESSLVQRGLLDPDVLRRHMRPEPGRKPDANIDATLNCVAFVRNQSQRSSAGKGK